MSGTITIIATKVIDPDQFESMYIDERRNISVGWKTFPSRTGRYPDGILHRATKVSLGVTELEPGTDIPTGLRLHSFILDWKHLERVLPNLVAVVETRADESARALVATCGGTADLARVTEALRKGTWPESNDAAEETAAFAHQLLKFSRLAVSAGLGVCWEYRGDFPLGDQQLLV